MVIGDGRRATLLVRPGRAPLARSGARDGRRALRRNAARMEQPGASTEAPCRRAVPHVLVVEVVSQVRERGHGGGRGQSTSATPTRTGGTAPLDAAEWSRGQQRNSAAAPVADFLTCMRERSGMTPEQRLVSGQIATGSRRLGRRISRTLSTRSQVQNSRYGTVHRS
jgi:hypothetical protein